VALPIHRSSNEELENDIKDVESGHDDNELIVTETSNHSSDSEETEIELIRSARKRKLGESAHESIDESKGEKAGKKQNRSQFDPAKAQLKDLIFKCNYGIPTKAAAAKIEARKNKIKKKDADEEPGSPNVSQPKKKEDEPLILEDNISKKSNAMNPAAPKVQVIDGRIVINQESLVVQSGQVDNNLDIGDTFEESNTHITAYSFSNRVHAKKWTPAETAKFYRALSQCGTDFSLIEKLFPARSRLQIKSKFKREERDHPGRIDYALAHRIPLDLLEYEAKTGISTDPNKRKEREKEQEIATSAVDDESTPITTSTSSEVQETTANKKGTKSKGKKGKKSIFEDEEISETTEDSVTSSKAKKQKASATPVEEIEAENSITLADDEEILEDFQEEAMNVNQFDYVDDIDTFD